jgi:hypothetical protein
VHCFSARPANTRNRPGQAARPPMLGSHRPENHGQPAQPTRTISRPRNRAGATLAYLPEVIWVW